jgi:ABC-type branched-subunit amino acid transport system ATPase component
VVLPDDIDVISELSERMSVMKDGDVFPEKEQEIISVIERVVRQTTAM